jgi:hypothetical protein
MAVSSMDACVTSVVVCVVCVCVCVCVCGCEWWELATRVRTARDTKHPPSRHTGCCLRSAACTHQTDRGCRCRECIRTQRQLINTTQRPQRVICHTTVHHFSHTNAQRWALNKSQTHTKCKCRIAQAMHSHVCTVDNVLPCVHKQPHPHCTDASTLHTHSYVCGTPAISRSHIATSLMHR